MNLVLDTRTRQIWICLLRGKSTIAERYQVVAQPSAVLMAVEQFLRKSQVPIKRLTQITVVIGPGTFSFLRAGIVIANTLATVHRLPSRGVKAKNDADAVPLSRFTRKTTSRKPLRPWYGGAPSITIAGRKGSRG